MAAAVASLSHLRNGAQAHRTLARQFHLALFIRLLVSLLTLLSLFVTGNFAFDYIYRHSASSTPLVYRLSGVWAGRQGTLLIWLWTAVGALGIEDLRHQMPHDPKGRTGKHSRRKSKLAPGGFFAYVRTIALLFIVGLALIQLTLDPFELVEGAAPADGKDLHPLLRNPWMVIHPPVVFIAYGLMTPVLAAGLAYLLTRRREWAPVATRWARWSWVGMGVALVLGGLWAYGTLGWGGYWAWDPVETSSLLPWLGLTAFLHIICLSRKQHSHSVLGPLLAGMVVALALFSSFVTRGGLWSSVHAFMPSQSTDLTRRLLEVFEKDPSVQGFFMLLLGIVGVTSALTLRAFFKWPEPKVPERKSLTDHITEETTLAGSVFAILLLLAISLMLLLLELNGTLGPAVYNSRLMMGACLLTGIFLLGTLYPWMETKDLVLLTGGVLVAMTIGAVIGIRQGNDRYLLGAALPAFIGTAGAIGYHLHRLRGKPASSGARTAEPIGFLQKAMPWMVHLGFALMLLGHSATVSLSHKERFWLEVGQTREVAGYLITLEELELPETNIDRGNAATRFASTISVATDRGEVGSGDPAFLVHHSWNNERTFDIFLLHRLHEDVYISMNRYNYLNQTVQVSVTVNPGVNLVWLGAGLLIIGELLYMGLEWPPMRKRLKRAFQSSRGSKS